MKVLLKEGVNNWGAKIAFGLNGIWVVVAITMQEVKKVLDDF